MKIAVLSSQLPSAYRTKSGGVAYTAHRLANELTIRGHSVTVFTTDERPPGACYDVQKIFSARPDNPLRAWLWLWQVAWRYRVQDYGDFDIIHSHGDDALIARSGPPLVRTLHGASWAESIYATTWKRRLWYLTITPSELWEVARATQVVSVSANTRKYVPGINLVIPNFVSLNVFHPGPNLNEDLRSHHPVILFVGTLAGRKRGRMLLELFQSQIRTALPDAELWVVAERIVQAPGVVCFQTPDEQTLADLYRRAWVFCLPSTYEGFGIPYIEAMACGTPVAATPNAGARELLENGKWGVLARPSELAKTLLSLLNDSARLRSLAQLGLKRAESFSQDRVVSAYEELFASTVENRRLLNSGREE